MGTKSYPVKTLHKDRANSSRPCGEFEKLNLFAGLFRSLSYEKQAKKFATTASFAFAEFFKSVSETTK